MQRYPQIKHYNRFEDEHRRLVAHQSHQRLEDLINQERNIESMLISLRESFTQAKFIACGEMMKRYIHMGGEKKIPYFAELNTILRNQRRL